MDVGWNHGPLECGIWEADATDLGTLKATVGPSVVLVGAFLFLSPAETETVLPSIHL